MRKSFQFKKKKKKLKRIDKNEEEIMRNRSYKVKYIDGEGFMANTLPNLVENLA